MSMKQLPVSIPGETDELNRDIDVVLCLTVQLTPVHAMLTKGSGSRKTLWVYPKWYKTSNEKGHDKPLQNSAKFAPLDSLAKLAREASLDGLDWGLAVLVAAEHAVEPCYLVHVGFGGSGGVLLQAAD
jgi:hypothetical protein